MTGDEMADLGEALRAMRLLSDNQSFYGHKLTGGVSCDVWKVDIAGRAPIVVKRALSKLRVAADWHAPPERSSAEIAWLRLAGSIDRTCAPAILAADTTHHVFAMAYLDPADYPLWKAELAAGRIDVEFAARTGQKLALLHASTAGRREIADAFANQVQFHALRLESYLLFTAGRHPDLAQKIAAMADAIAGARIALMQGDVSPKNILCGRDGPVFLDAETACYGDPAFDLAFCLSHLLLKCVWHPEFTGAYLDSFRALKQAYLAGVNWEDPTTIGQRTAQFLGALLLARVDGKSPVEYLTEARDIDFLRARARQFIVRGESSLDAIAQAFAGLGEKVRIAVP